MGDSQHQEVKHSLVDFTGKDQYEFGVITTALNRNKVKEIEMKDQVSRFQSQTKKIHRTARYRYWKSQRRVS